MTIKTKSTLETIKPYVQGKSTLEGIAEPLKLSSNELPYPPSPAAIKAFHAVSACLGRYPDGAQTALRQAIAEIYGIDAGSIFASNGSEEAIGLVIRSVLSAGDNMVISENSFLMAEIYARSCGAEIRKAKETDYRVDVDALLALVDQNTRIMYVCSPNNPTGTFTPASELARLEAALPPGVLMIIDSAYAEFVTDPAYDCGIATLFKPQGRVVVTHTLSKAYGLAGIRIGWAAAPTDIIDAVSRLRTPFNTNIAALSAAEAAIRDRGYLDAITGMINQTREWFTEGLTALGLSVVPSHTNFVLIVFPAGGSQACDLDATLQRAGILGRAVTGGANEFRITIGTKEQMQQTLDVARQWVSSYSSY
ncbi:histidinol-phosphate aminotransferase 1 [Ensifer adhaerens OV14]|uniref:histidinol-phosphate transaminase n=1 Tax=Ensifer canadensis TaxID=555315 RepID=UPI00042EB4F9|nr:histidinol-phosphate transaminase [Ensifer canadensis]AHK46510.1 histidinol-phosphate aminotransferase 1 [Ensifer adhaerens OV14]NOV17763.1 histidinol-phosphate transaminase [Ensifer canadensis]